MTTCEFKKECETAIVGKCTHPEWRIEEDDCPHRKFAILVVNRTVEKAIGQVFDLVDVHVTDDHIEQKGTVWMGRLEALKMEED